MISDDIIHEAQNYEVMFNDILKADTDRRLQQEITRDINWARKTLRKNDRIIWFLRWSKIWYQLSGGIWAGGRADTSLSAALQQYNQRFQTRYVAGDLRSPPVLKTQLEHFLGLPVPEIQNTYFGLKARGNCSSFLRNMRRYGDSGSRKKNHSSRPNRKTKS